MEQKAGDQCSHAEQCQSWKHHQHDKLLQKILSDHMYIPMNVISSSTPSPLMVHTGKFSHPELTTGRPYQVYRRQLNRAIVYGVHENSSTLAFFITLLNVNLWKKCFKHM